MPFIILCMLLSGCGAEKNTISTDTPAETAIQTSEIELKGETESSSKNATETTAESSLSNKIHHSAPHTSFPLSNGEISCKMNRTLNPAHAMVMI